AFFFINYEEFYQPTSTPLRTRQLLNEQVAGGLFRYNVTSGGATITREVNVLTVAGANGQTTSMDPTVSALVAQMRSLANDTVSAGTGVISNQGSPVLDQLDFKSPGKYVNPLPPTRVDLTLSQSPRLSGRYWW